MHQKHIVIFTGAGISAESGISTFRDSNGLWENHDITQVASPQGFAANPALVLNFYNLRRQNVLQAQPNLAHTLIADLQNQYQISIITQNIDDLHERAGNQNITHLHGQITLCRSVKNPNITYPYSHDLQIGDTAPDGGQLRPHIVWFGEDVPMMDQAINTTKTADMFVVIGSSLVVYPAASLLHFVPSHVPIFVIDKQIPDIKASPNLTTIEMPATQGVAYWIEKYLKYGFDMDSRSAFNP